jgi:hypothetical protein
MKQAQASGVILGVASEAPLTTTPRRLQMNRVIAPLAVIAALTVGAVTASAAPKTLSAPEFFAAQQLNGN